jgi:hypothetical protein
MPYRIDFTASQYARRKTRLHAVLLSTLLAVGGAVYGGRKAYEHWSAPPPIYLIRQFNDLATPLEALHDAWEMSDKAYDGIEPYCRLLWSESVKNALFHLIASRDQMPRLLRPKTWRLRTGGEVVLVYELEFEGRARRQQMDAAVNALETMFQAWHPVIERPEPTVDMSTLTMTARFSLAPSKYVVHRVPESLRRVRESILKRRIHLENAKTPYGTRWAEVASRRWPHRGLANLDVGALTSEIGYMEKLLADEGWPPLRLIEKQRGDLEGFAATLQGGYNDDEVFVEGLATRQIEAFFEGSATVSVTLGAPADRHRHGASGTPMFVTWRAVLTPRDGGRFDLSDLAAGIAATLDPPQGKRGGFLIDKLALDAEYCHERGFGVKSAVVEGIVPVMVRTME